MRVQFLIQQKSGPGCLTVLVLNRPPPHTTTCNGELYLHIQYVFIRKNKVILTTVYLSVYLYLRNASLLAPQ
jgi:hypothetical protein